MHLGRDQEFLRLPETLCVVPNHLCTDPDHSPPCSSLEVPAVEPLERFWGQHLLSEAPAGRVDLLVPSSALPVTGHARLSKRICVISDVPRGPEDVPRVPPKHPDRQRSLQKTS